MLSFFMKNPKKKYKFLKILKNLKIFGKKSNFKKTFKLQIALKIRFLSYDSTKKIATRFYHEDYISKKKFGARADSYIAVKTQKSWIFA